jgi:hypothetical protein
MPDHNMKILTVDDFSTMRRSIRNMRRLNSRHVQTPQPLRLPN